MSSILDGKIALVTGVSRDGQVGQAVAKALAGQGAAPVIVARTQTNVAARAEKLRASGARVFPLATDLTDESQVGQVIKRTIR